MLTGWLSSAKIKLGLAQPAWAIYCLASFSMCSAHVKTVFVHTLHKFCEIR
uniref:Uncharacterized protein n=1 Tax=Tetranychus urticae TaxID=32264 RepID=T1K6P1_TETUR